MTYNHLLNWKQVSLTLVGIWGTCCFGRRNGGTIAKTTNGIEVTLPSTIFDRKAKGKENQKENQRPILLPLESAVAKFLNNQTD